MKYLTMWKGLNSVAKSTTVQNKQQSLLLRPWVTVCVIVGALLIAALLVWQGINAGGTPDPTGKGTSPIVAIFDIAALVFREGLECMLVLTAITASMQGANRSYQKPIGVGALLGFIATLITWFIAVSIVDNLLNSVSALSLQAWTGLLAIVVLLVVMNWFFHKVYWTGWISFQNRKKRDLLQSAKTPGSSRTAILVGLIVLGLTSIYREGFEVVLFLQSYRLQMGNVIVFYGALVGLVLWGIVGFLNFVAHRHLPYKRMLIVTGVLLTMVLFLMVGEEIFEMQQAGWLATTTISWLAWIPDWAGIWFSIFPNWESIIAQALVVAIVLGCYFLSRYQAVLLPKKRGAAPYKMRESAPAEDVVSNQLSPAGTKN
jgi:high-affinity iron transporter